MPNQRDKSKKGVSVYVPDTIKNALKAEAQKRNLTMSEFVTAIYKDKLSEFGYDVQTNLGE